MSTLTTTPQYDSLLDAALPTTADPTATTARIGFSGGGKRLAMRFDLTSLPPSIVSAATLTLTNTGSGGTFIAGAYFARRLDNSIALNYSLMEWDHYDGVTAWAGGGGGDYTITGQATCTIASATASPSFTVTTLAQDALTSRSSYLDLLIMGDENSAESIVVCTKDHGTANNRPSLVVTYTLAGGLLWVSRRKPILFTAEARP